MSQPCLNVTLHWCSWHRCQSSSTQLFSVTRVITQYMSKKNKNIFLLKIAWLDHWVIYLTLVELWWTIYYEWGVTCSLHPIRLYFNCLSSTVFNTYQWYHQTILANIELTVTDASRQFSISCYYIFKWDTIPSTVIDSERDSLIRYHPRSDLRQRWRRRRRWSDLGHHHPDLPCCNGNTTDIYLKAAL